MKTRAQIYNGEANSILKYISMYRVMHEEQLLRLFPEKRSVVRNLLTYLTKQGRIWHIDSLYCAAPEFAKDVDQGLMAALWVLVDFADRAEYHTTADYPAKILFSVGDKVFEIVYAEEGKDALLSYVMGITKKDRPNYIVLVDDPAQIEGLDLPNVVGYCTVSPDGKVEYYQKE